MAEIENLKTKLAGAYALFVKRGMEDWASLTKNALEKIENNDFSPIDDLWLKFSPTGKIDDLFITAPQPNHRPFSEKEANELNDELGEIANDVFWALDKVRETKT